VGKPKTKRICVRLKPHLFDMIDKLKILFDGNFTDTLEAILEQYRGSPLHKEQIDRLNYLLFEGKKLEVRLRELIVTQKQ